MEIVLYKETVGWRVTKERGRGDGRTGDEEQRGRGAEGKEVPLFPAPQLLGPSAPRRRVSLSLRHSSLC